MGGRYFIVRAHATRLTLPSHPPRAPPHSHVLPQFYGGKEALMRAHFGLPSVASEDASDAEKWRKRSIQVRGKK